MNEPQRSLDQGRHTVQVALGVTFAILAGIVALGSVVRSLWLYPLS